MKQLGSEGFLQILRSRTEIQDLDKLTAAFPDEEAAVLSLDVSEILLRGFPRQGHYLLKHDLTQGSGSET